MPKHLAIDLTHIQPRSKDELNVIVETPKNSNNKYKYDDDLGMFTISKILPTGCIFPYDFGFLPGTLADDGDPLDVLLFLDTNTFPGCLVKARAIGVIEAEQEEDGKKERNDRIVAVASESRDHSDVNSLKDMNKHLLDEIERFFKNYNAAVGKKFKILNLRGPRTAAGLIDAAIKTHKKEHATA